MNVTGKDFHAVVVGGSFAGLTSARVLANYFPRVTVIDRDWLPEEPVFRAGVPQAHHAHTLLPLGQILLDRLFPGMTDQLVSAGAPSIYDERDTFTYEHGTLRVQESKRMTQIISCSRPMLDQVLYRRVADIPQIEILQGYEVVDLFMDEQQGKVTGIKFRERNRAASLDQSREAVREVLADLVVDASGRNSKAPQWLSKLGFLPPEEWRIDAHAGYASRIYEQPENFHPDWKKLYISPSPPNGTRGGVIIPIEGNRWHVTLIGIAGDYPQTDESGFLAFAQSLESQELYHAIRRAKPLSRISGFRKGENRVRRYECLPRYLEGLLVSGDAAFTMNPIYALGMTAAVVGSQVLDQVLKGSTQMAEISSKFQKRLMERVSALWQQAVSSDWNWPATEISDNTEELYAAAA